MPKAIRRKRILFASFSRKSLFKTLVLLGLVTIALLFEQSTLSPLRLWSQLNWQGLAPAASSSGESLTKNVTEETIIVPDVDHPLKTSTTSHLFTIPESFRDRVDFWTLIYAQYTSNDAVFHDTRNLSIVYKVVDLRPITESNLHPFTKEHRVKSLIQKERALLKSHLEGLARDLQKGISPSRFKGAKKDLWEQLGRPTKSRVVSDAASHFRMQLGQKDFIQQALLNSDLYLPIMEEIFLSKNLPIELTRMPFVESSFNLNARSRVGASGIWQIMPATGRKLMPNDHVDYRNDPIKATEFAAGLLRFNYKVIDAWPLAITAYNHGPTSISKLSKKHKTKDIQTLIDRAYGSNAFKFASSNFYACFLAMLEVEKNRDRYFPELPRQIPLEFSRIQLKKPIAYRQLLGWFDKDSSKAALYNPHLSAAIRNGSVKIPARTQLYLPSHLPELVGVATLEKEFVASSFSSFATQKEVSRQ